MTFKMNHLDLVVQTKVVFLFLYRMLIMTSRQNGNLDNSNLDRTRDILVGDNNEVDIQPSIDNVEMSNLNSYTAMTPAPQNITYEFYQFYVIYTALRQLEIVRLLNNRVDTLLTFASS